MLFLLYHIKTNFVKIKFKKEKKKISRGKISKKMRNRQVFQELDEFIFTFETAKKSHKDKFWQHKSMDKRAKG